MPKEKKIIDPIDQNRGTFLKFLQRLKRVIKIQQWEKNFPVSLYRELLEEKY